MNLTGRARLSRGTVAMLIAPLAVSWIMTLNIWPGWPEPGQVSVAYLTHALYHRGELQVDTEAASFLGVEDLSKSGDHQYSIKPPALSFWLLLFAPLLDAVTPGPLNIFQIIYFGRLVAQTLPLLLFAWFFGRLLERSAGPAAGWGCLLLVAAGTPFYCYANYLYAHAMSAALLGGSLVLLWSKPPGALGRAAAAFMIAAAATGDLCSVPAAAVVMASSLFLGEGPALKRWCWSALGAAPPVLLMAAYQKLCFGSAWTFSYLHGKGKWESVPSVASLFHRVDLAHFWEVTFGTWRGVFFYSPWTLVAVILCAHALLKRNMDVQTRRRVGTGFAAFAAQVLFLTVYQRYPGSFSFGLRYLVPSLPLLTAACAMALPSMTRPARDRYLTALAATGLYSLALHALAMSIFPHFPSPGPEKVNSIRAFILPALREGLSTLTLLDAAGLRWPWSMAVYWLPTVICPCVLTVVCVRGRHVASDKAFKAVMIAVLAALVLWTVGSSMGPAGTPESEGRRRHFNRLLTRPGSRPATVKGFMKMVWPGPEVSHEELRFLMWPTRSRSIELEAVKAAKKAGPDV